MENRDYAFDFAAKNASYFDIINISPEKKSISVEQVRKINSEIFIKPNGERKIYILEADNITEQAQNALLKTLEESPPYATIILIGKRASFLSTILSRCVYIPSAVSFPKLPEEIINFINEFEKSDLGEIFEHYRFLEENKETIEDFLDFMQIFFRESLLKGAVNSINKILIVQKAKVNLRRNANFQITLEDMLIQLRKG